MMRAGGGRGIERSQRGNPVGGQVLLLHANTSDFKLDSSSYGRTGVYPNGSASLSSVSGKFSSAVRQAGAANNPMDFTGAGLDIGTGDFTIDVWVRIEAFIGGSGVQFVITDSPVTVSILQHNANTQMWEAPGFIVASSSNIGAWDHLAVTRASGVGYFFFNGTLRDSRAYTPNFTGIRVFGNSAVVNQALALDEIRVIKGQAVWTSSFTPPAVPYLP